MSFYTVQPNETAFCYSLPLAAKAPWSQQPLDHYEPSWDAEKQGRSLPTMRSPIKSLKFQTHSSTDWLFYRLWAFFQQTAGIKAVNFSALSWSCFLNQLLNCSPRRGHISPAGLWSISHCASTGLSSNAVWSLHWYLQNPRHSRMHNLNECTADNLSDTLGWREVSRIRKGYWKITLSYLNSSEVKCQVNVKSSLRQPHKHCWHFSLSL